MYYRRKILLSILERSKNQTITKLSLQKILFLFSKKQTNPVFDFVPYKQGCFSFQANKDLSVLETHYQQIENYNKKWRLKENHNYFADLTPEDKKNLVEILERFLVQDEANLINYTYQNYPYFAIHSLREVALKQKNIIDKEKKNIQQQTEKKIFSIGYEAISIDGYLNKLIKNNIHLLCDVRCNAFSMKYGFSKKQLLEKCKALNITYCHLSELGIESKSRKDIITKEDYANLFKQYKASLNSKKELIQKVVDFFHQYKRIALTCFEKKHTDCHRSRLSDYLAKNYKIKIEHL